MRYQPLFWFLLLLGTTIYAIASGQPVTCISPSHICLGPKPSPSPTPTVPEPSPSPTPTVPEPSPPSQSAVTEPSPPSQSAVTEPSPPSRYRYTVSAPSRNKFDKPTSTEAESSSIATKATLIAPDDDPCISIHADASIRAPLCHCGSAGAAVQILGKKQDEDNDTWYQVKFDESDVEGWVFSRFVSLVD